VFDPAANTPGNTVGTTGPVFFRDEIDQAGIDRIDGLDEVITAADMFSGIFGSDFSDDIKQIFSGGNVLLGGGGDDVLTGKGGNDILDGDRWLNVRIRITQPGQSNTAANEISTIDSLKHVFTAQDAGHPSWIGKSLAQLMLDRVIVPNQLHIVREVLDGDVNNTDVDTAVFWDVIDNYTITTRNDGTIVVEHTGFAAANLPQALVDIGFKPFSDGIDVVRNVELFKFGDGLGGFQTFTRAQLIPFAATGAAVINDTTPQQGQTLSVDTSTIADQNGLGTFFFQWQNSADNGATWQNIAGANGATFAIPDAPGTQLGQFFGEQLRVVVLFIDGRGDEESIASAATGPVGINYTAVNSNVGVNFTGRGGDDVIRGSAQADTLSGGLGDDQLNGGGSADTLNGNDGNDILLGVGGGDTLNGGDGDDILNGGAGDDTLNGGNGVDTAEYAGPVQNFIIRTGGVGNVVLAQDNAGNEGLDVAQTIEVMRFNGVDYTLVWDTSGGANNAVNGVGGQAGNQLVFGMNGADTLYGGDGSDILVGGFGNDTIFGGAGNDFIFHNADETGRDIIDGGDGTDYYILAGQAGAETFRIYTRAAALAAGITNIAANTEIVITRNGTNNGSIIAQLDNIEEIKINTLNSTANNGNNATAPDGGNSDGDTIIVIGDFTQTSLDYNTIRVSGSSGNDTVDITGLESDHRLVFNSNGGTDTILGQVRTQDVINGDNINDLRTAPLVETATGITPMVAGAELSGFGSTDGLDMLLGGLNRQALRDMMADHVALTRGNPYRVEFNGMEELHLTDVVLGRNLSSLENDFGATLSDLAQDFQPFDLVNLAESSLPAGAVGGPVSLDYRTFTPSQYDLLPF